MEIVAAGLPRWVVGPRDYEPMLKELRSNGITSVFPHFDEIADFVAPQSSSDPAVAAMASSGVKLLIPGHIVYPDLTLPPLDNDPLVRLLETVGRENVAGITNYDEPAFAHPLEQVAGLYERVKQIDASLPVSMVHAPCPRWYPGAVEEGKNPRPLGPNDTDLMIPIETYFNRVLEYSTYADNVGFDVYPVPELFQDAITTPYRGGLGPTDHCSAVADYTRWLRENVGKEYFMVLMSFAAEDNDETDEMFDLKGIEKRAPRADELVDMAVTARDGGCSMVVWWGAQLLSEKNSSVWDGVLEASRKIAGS